MTSFKERFINSMTKYDKFQKSTTYDKDIVLL